MARQRKPGGTADRGYDGAHQAERKRWESLVASGQVQCHARICKKVLKGGSRWLKPTDEWHLGHTPDRRGWTGPEHAECNLSEAGIRGNRGRPKARPPAAQPWKTTQHW